MFYNIWKMSRKKWDYILEPTLTRDSISPVLPRAVDFQLACTSQHLLRHQHILLAGQGFLQSDHFQQVLESLPSLNDDHCIGIHYYSFWTSVFCILNTRGKHYLHHYRLKAQTSHLLKAMQKVGGEKENQSQSRALPTSLFFLLFWGRVINSATSSKNLAGDDN